MVDEQFMHDFQRGQGWKAQTCSDLNGRQCISEWSAMVRQLLSQNGYCMTIRALGQRFLKSRPPGAFQSCCLCGKWDSNRSLLPSVRDHLVDTPCRLKPSLQTLTVSSKLQLIIRKAAICWLRTCPPTAGFGKCSKSVVIANDHPF